MILNSKWVPVKFFFVGVQGFKGSGVQRFRGSRFHSCPWTAFEMRIYEKSVSFVRPNRKFGAKLVIIWQNEHFKPELRVFNAFFALNPER
jgi:hypothetical protein